FISDSLKEGKIINFDKIHKRRDEFSDLANIIELFFEQKKKIEEEIIKVNYSNEALTLSEKKFFSLFNNSPIGIFQTTIEGKVIIANKYLYSVLGYDDSDINDIDLKKNLYLYPEQRDVFLKYYYENKFIKDAEINLKKKDNSTITFIMNSYSVRDKDGNILYIEGTLSDVTEIKKLNEDLYKLKLASMQSLDGIAILNNESKFEYVNKSFATMHGYNIDDLIGKHLGLIHSEEQMGLQRIKLRKAVIEKGYFEGEISHLKRDGSFLPTFMSITSIKNINNDIVGWLAITRDITELINTRELIEFLNIQLKKKVYVQNIDLINNNIKLEKTVIELKEKEKVITQSEQLYNSTVNSIKEWLHVVDKDLKFILLNTSFKEKLNELNISQDLVNTYLADNFNFLDSEVIMRYQTVFKTGNIDKSEEITNINDKTYYTETVRTPVFDENNNVIRVITVIRDISDRILFEQKLLSAIVKTGEAEKRRFAEDLHDVLGALLSAMKIFVNAAIKKSKTGENIDDLLLQIKEMIIEGVVNIRNIAYNLSPNILNDFGLLKAISNYCDKLNTTSQIKIKFDSHNLNCQLDKIIEINIYRIILELINNTLKHSSAKNINLSLALKKNIIYIDYSDDGIGFDMANNHHNLSFRGMGLNNILARVKLLRGKCNFNSMEGQGFKAHIYFENFNFVV
ncbi:MAG: PAS domain S-box protein, partial [Bacteroidales bacterium]|nr:PAS domain S-box protein [Bacteroidales bacterium]